MTDTLNRAGPNSPLLQIEPKPDGLTCGGLVLNVPEFFADPAFQRWLENDAPKFAWHRGGTVDEWSDVIVLVDPGLGGEGSDSDMPAVLWTQIIEACHQHLGVSYGGSAHYMVRLTNLLM